MKWLMISALMLVSTVAMAEEKWAWALTVYTEHWDNVWPNRFASKGDCDAAGKQAVENARGTFWGGKPMVELNWTCYETPIREQGLQ